MRTVYLFGLFKIDICLPSISAVFLHNCVLFARFQDYLALNSNKQIMIELIQSSICSAVASHPIFVF